MAVKNPFLIYSSQLNKLFARAKSEKNPALWLYTNDARVAFFMLQGLCRIFDNGLHNPWFAHWHKVSKKLEDGLGQIDFYDAFIKEYSNNKKPNPEVTYYLQTKREKALKKFSKKINKENYLEKGFKDFESELKKQNVKWDAETISKVDQFIKGEIKALEIFAAYNNYTYEYLEDHVHELRRKLRWIGIYSQALQGIVKLAEDKKKFRWETKYLTKEILNSPFNIIPKNKWDKHIEFEKKHFYALNWFINELGILKDKGLKVELLSKALRKTGKIERAESIRKAQLTLSIRQNETDILKRASFLSKEFFETNKIMSELIYQPSTKDSKD